LQRLNRRIDRFARRQGEQFERPGGGAVGQVFGQLPADRIPGRRACW